MKRAPIVLTATAAGLAATLGFNPHSKAPTATGVTATSPSTSSSSSSTKSATGDAIANQYGNVQLNVTISGGKITKIQPVQLPSHDPKSSQISSYAEPLLRQSALAKQSADIDSVSGATYTSNGYKTALQSALDKTAFQVSSTSGSA
jgi:uncharacterized protein with FMN-binding domain